MEEENTNTENTGAESTATETTTETATAPEPTPAAATATPSESDDGGEKKLPVFLKVLCILTFIASGGAVLGGIFQVIGSSVNIPLVSYLVTAGGGTTYAILGLVMAAGSLFGAIMMWKLKKTGFYLYAAANLCAVVLPFIFIEFYTFGMAIMSLIFTSIFIVLYYLNVKHMS